MNPNSYRTEFLRSSDVEKKWFVIDAENQVVGRLASNIAKVIRGKHKPTFTPNADCGDNIIVINAEKVRFTGRKLTDKEYLRHTGFPGGQKAATPKEVLAKHPTRILEHAVRHMLPKNRLGRKLFNNVYIYAGSEHPHAAQQPSELKF
ncbi:MAG: 50S ribosomal protein L13 [Cytophagales bacterium]